MRISVLNLFFLLPALFIFTITPAQSDERIHMIKGIYTALQEGDASSRYMAALPADIEQEQVKEFNERNSLSFSSIIKNEWESLVFRELKFQLPSQETIFVTGIVEGRKATECEYISRRFSHSWSLKNNKLVKFTEH